VRFAPDVTLPRLPLPRVVVVMPALDAARTLSATLRDLPAGLADEVLLVDDGSSDGTPELAESLGLTVVRHERRRGYGGNQKTCYRLALARGADVVVLLHPDWQYDARMLPAMVEVLRLGICDVVLGSRVRSRREALAGGMPPWKYLANRLLTVTGNVVLGQNLGDAHTGLRAYTRRVLQTVAWERNSDDFVFDSQLLAQCAACGFRIGDVPVPARYFPEASSIGGWSALRYGAGTLAALGRFALHRAGLRARWLEPVAQPAQPAPDGPVAPRHDGAVTRAR
jgi:glycosyltransferase involved in cell wall biosynthesis